MTSPKSSTPSLRDLALEHIGEIAAALQKADPTLTKQQAVAKAAQTPGGLEARRLINTPGSHLPAVEAVQAIVKRAVAKAAGPDSATLAAYKRWRADLDAKDGVAKEGGGGGSGPRGGRVEDPKTRGPKAPADTLPNLSDSIYAKLRADAIAANPTMSAEQAVVAYLTTSAGEAAHAQWSAARQQEAQ